MIMFCISLICLNSIWYMLCCVYIIYIETIKYKCKIVKFLEFFN